jgi:tetratricopeptide (TPR) repeat protein
MSKYKYAYLWLFIIFCSTILLFTPLIFPGCAPYSLPDKKTYSEKEDPYIYYAQSLEFYEAKNYQLALENIDIALNLNSNLAQFYLLKGDILRSLSENDKAIETYKIAIKKRSNFIEAHLSLADLYERLKQFDEAIRYYKKAAGLEPERIEILLLIVDCYIQWNEMSVADHFLNNYEKSANELKKSVSDRFYVLRGEVLFLTNKYEQSLEFLSNVSQQDSLTLYLYGKNYYALGDFNKGVTYFNMLLNEDKNNGSWYLYRGIYFFEQKDYVDARGQFQYALELDSTLYEPHYYLGKIFLDESDNSAALKEFNLYLQHDVEKAKLEEVNKIIQTLTTTTE